MHGLKNDFNNECKESRLILCEISKVFNRVLVGNEHDAVEPKICMVSNMTSMAEK
jgi:hypothetical protein